LIFVTVGTTIPFDGLLEAVDNCVARSVIDGPVVCQIGSGEYEPKHCEWFKYQPSIQEFVNRADLIIGHGGTGTTFQLLASDKPFISFANPLAAADHQAEFLARMASAYDIIWSRDPGELEALLPKARDHRPKPFAEPRLHDHLKAFLLS